MVKEFSKYLFKNDLIWAVWRDNATIFAESNIHNVIEFLQNDEVSLQAMAKIYNKKDS